MIERVIERYQAVFVFSFMIFIIGLVSYLNLPRESAPEIRRPLVFINTTYSGVSATDIETLITKKIEDELDGLEGLEKLTSTSRMHVSSVTAEFNQNIDVEVALRRVKERVDIAKAEIPQDAEEPLVRELNFSDQPFFIIAMANPNGLNVLEDLVDFLEEEIKAIPGVLDVRVSGKKTRELAIELNPERLKHYDFSIGDITKTIRDEHITIPGGQLRNDKLQYPIAVTGEIKDTEEFGQLTIRARGKQARLAALGTVALAHKPTETIARLNGEPAISLAITKRSGENLIRITEDIKALLDQEQGRFPFGTTTSYTFDNSRHIRDMVYDLENNIVTSFLMVVAVTLFFLGGINAIFVSIGIPFSMLMSFIVLSFMGITLNMVVLFSLVLALGMLVDNGIVIVENIYRHRTLGKSRILAATEGTREVALPIIASTITTTLAFFPIVFMPGIMGEFMGYLPKTVIIVLLSSLLVALTITPVFCSRFLKVTKESMAKMSGADAKGFGKILNHYEGVLARALARPWTTVAAAFGFVFLGIIIYGILGKQPIFFPNLDPDAATVEIEVPPGGSLAVTDDVTKVIAQKVNQVPASLESMQSTVGRGVGQGFGPGGDDPNKANIRLGFVPYVDREIPAMTTIQGIKDALKKETSGRIKVQQVKGGPPAGHPISYEIRGESYEVIGSLADQIKGILTKYEKAFDDIDYDYEKGKPEINIEIDREKATSFGLTTANIATTIRQAINGGLIGKYRHGKDEFDITVRYQEPYRDSIVDLKELEIIDKEQRIPLATVAQISTKAAISVIKRNNRRRAVNVWADFKESFTDREQVAKVKEGIARDIAKIQVPRGYRIGAGQGSKEQDTSQAFLIQAFFIALGAIFLVLVVQFNSLSQPLIIMISVFLSLGGVFWGLFLTGKTFGIIMSGIGVISLAGVVVNNAIVMIDFFNMLRRQGMAIQEAVMEAAKTRLRPVLLTALTTVIGLLPMGFAISFDFHTFTLQFGSQSAQMFKAMAWAMIFGLSLATVLTLVVLPVLLVLDDRFAQFLGRFIKSDEALEAQDRS